VQEHANKVWTPAAFFITHTATVRCERPLEHGTLSVLELSFDRQRDPAPFLSNDTDKKKQSTLVSANRLRTIDAL
jgi:hypothetical protein